MQSTERPIYSAPPVSTLPGIQKQHHIQVLHKNVIEFARYSTSEQKYSFRFCLFYIFKLRVLHCRKDVLN
jgi:hypothetical protein